jgi:IclR family transcriptional regulator, pca regulon regulatory protein
MNRPPSPIDKSHLIEGLGKGLAVMEAFSDEHPRLTATEAGRIAGLTRTAARRYLLSLVHFGYADTDGKHYWLKPRVLRLGQGFLASSRMPRLVQPFAQRLSNELGETANLSMLDGHEVVYVSRTAAPRVVSIGYPSGARVPAHVTAAGHVLLAQLGDAEVDGWIADHEFGRFTPNTTTDFNVFRTNVQKAREQGHWYANQYGNIGLCGLAIPLFDARGRCQGAISVVFQLQAYPQDRVEKVLLPALQGVATAVRPLL